MSNFDDAADIRRLRALFQEQMNATSGGDRPTMIPYEDYGYNFPPDQTFNTPPSEITLPPAQVYASGGAVDTMGGYDDYGSGRFTRTPAERRVNRERRIEQWVPPSPEDDWGAKEWSRFGTIHGYNPLSYGMEALGRLDSAGRDWEGRDYWDNLLDPNPHLYEKTGSLLGATADAASILTMGLPGKAAKVVGMGLPLLYDLGDELGRSIFGHADGGQVFDPEGDEYDYETALNAGLSPDDTEHWPSRDPFTGMLLKGRRHPTYDIGVAADRDLGLEEVLAGSGRYYTLPPGLREGGAVSKALRRIRSAFGETQGRRAEQAADLVNLDRFAEKSLVDLFDPANRDGGGLFVAMPTDRFQDYAPQLPQSAVDAIPYPRWKNVPRSAARGIDPLDRSQDTYLDLLGRRIEAKGLDEAPTLWLSRTGDPMTKVVEHEGRHRMMALDRLGDDRALVNLRPASSGEMRGEIDERIARLMSKYFPRGAGTMVIPQDSGLMRAPRAMYEEPFADGGKVLSKLARHVLGKPKQARLPGGETVEALPIREFEDVADTFARRHGNSLPSEYAPFDEDRARRIAEAYSPDALPAMTSETRGQNSWVNFGPHGDRNRTASGVDTIYADQKTGFLPPWAYEDSYAVGGSVDDDFLLYRPQMFADYAEGGRVGDVDDDMLLWKSMYYADGGLAPRGYFGSC